MAYPSNALQTVQTYQDASLAFLDNMGCFLNTSNKKFKDFQNYTGQLGATVGFDLPTRFAHTQSLVASFQGAEQRVHTLTVDQPNSVAFAFTTEELVYNVHDYMDKFGRGAIHEIGTAVESNVALNCETGPFRFYGDGTTAINSSNQLATALARFRAFGAPRHMTKGYLDVEAVPSIVNSNLGQFALNRNNEEANSWELGRFSECEWYESNLLPVHTAGTEGQQGSTLTVVSTTKNANGAITAITFSGCNSASDADSVKAYDRFQVSSGTALYFNTFVGNKPTTLPVQFMASSDAASTSGSQVTVTLSYPLLPTATPTGNEAGISTDIVAGMTFTVLPSHKVGMITAGDPLYLAMPRLPDQYPYPTANKADDVTGASVRLTHGVVFGQNEMGFIYDSLHGSTLVPEYAMAVIFPL